MDDLIADFVAECREMLEALGGEIVAWEAQPEDRARLDSIFRFVHTVKGNCGFFEFPRLEALSHAAEDALADVRAGRRVPDGALVSAVLAVIDRISEMVSAIEAGEDMPAGDDNHLIDALAAGAKGMAAPVVAATAAATKASAAPRTIRLSVELLDRLKAGKREIGLLAVSARQSGNQILIDIQDDGRGIDGKKLVDKAIATGVVTKDEAAQLSRRDQLALIFEAGLSTAQEVTAISGRGVGMDVVRSNIERIGGIVEVDSKPGEGTRMTLRVPLTLTIIPALTVSIAGQHFAIPRSAIEEIVRANGESVKLEHFGGAGAATIRGRRVPEVSLAAILGLDSQIQERERTLIVLRPAGGDVYALSVDRIHDHEELVVKPAAPAVMATGLYAGTTLADDGSPILLFDPVGLADVGGVKLEAQERAARIAEGSAAPVAKATAVLLFRGLDGGRRALRLAVVDRIEEVPVASVKAAA